MITLFAANTSNGHRIAIMLEEAGLAYEISLVNLRAQQHKHSAFLAMNPVGKVPLIVDPEGDDAGPIVLSETIAICLYLAQKSGRLSPDSVRDRLRAWEWCARIATGFTPASSGLFFSRQQGGEGSAVFVDKFVGEFDQYYRAMDTELSASRYLAGDHYSIADVMAAPAVLTSVPQYDLDISPYRHLLRWRDEIAQRPAVQRGIAAVKGAARPS